MTCIGVCEQIQQSSQMNVAPKQTVLLIQSLWWPYHSPY